MSSGEYYVKKYKKKLRQENGMKEIQMELDYINLMTELNTKEILDMMNLMDKGQKLGLMGQNSKVVLILVKNVEQVDFNGLMEQYMKETWLMIKWKVENILI